MNFRTRLRLARRLGGWTALVRGLRAELSERERITVHPPALRFPVRLRWGTTDLAVAVEAFVSRIYDFDTVRPPRTIVDGGANVGLVSIHLASRFPEARILAVEPEVRNFELLVENVAPYPNVTPVNAALWDRCGKVVVTDPGRGDWGFRTEAGAPPPRRAVRGLVRATTLAELLDEHGLDTIDLLKLDVEGAEREILAGSSEWIHRVDALVVELHDRFMPGCARAFYAATGGFALEWHVRQNVFVSRGNVVIPAIPPRPNRDAT